MVMFFAMEPDDDPAAIDTLEIVKPEPQMVTLRDKVTGDEQVVNAELANIILILKQVGYTEVKE